MRLGGLFASIALAGCSAGSPALGIQEELAGSFHLGYMAPDGSDISYDSGSAIFEGTGVPTGCCLNLERYTASTLQLALGTKIAPGGDRVCDPIVQVVTVLEGIDEIWTPTAIDVSGTVAQVEYAAGSAELTECQAAPAWEVSEGLTLAGQVKLDELHCASPIGGLGCALVATGSWSITGSDLAGNAVLFSNGNFDVTDETL